MADLSEGQFVKSSTVFPRFKGKGYPEPTSDEYEEMDVPTNRLVATQSVITTNPSRTPEDPIHVTHSRGWYYVGTGHHRSAEAIGRGDETIRARVYPSTKRRR